MAIFRAFAKVLEAGDPSMLVDEAGLRACPGRPGLVLADEVTAFFEPHRDKSPMAVGFGSVSGERWRARARLVIVVIAIAAMPISAAMV